MISSYYKILTLILMLPFSILSIAQKDQKESEKINKFLVFVRDSVFKNKDTLWVAEKLDNSVLFKGGTFFFDRPQKGIKYNDEQINHWQEHDSLFTDQEMAYAYQQQHDTAKYKIPSGLLKNTFLINEKVLKVIYQYTFYPVYQPRFKFYESRNTFVVDSVSVNPSSGEKRNFVNSKKELLTTTDDLKNRLLLRYVVLSKPVFLKNQHYCIFSYAGYYRYTTLLFKKENNQWMQIKVMGMSSYY